VTTGRYLLCYGGSTGVRTAGAADGPGVRRAHDLSTTAWPARFEAEDHVWFEDRWMVASLCDE
jgi:hypothetical protein